MSTSDLAQKPPRALEAVDEPVRRYFTHALDDGAPSHPRVRVAMTGRIKVGPWLPFVAQWEGDGRSFTWRAAAGWPPLRVLRVIDRYAKGAGAMDVRLFGAIPLVHADDEDTTRSAAGRAAVESAMWAPAGVLPERGVSWRAETDNRIVGTSEVPPEHPQVRLEIDAEGALRSASVMRWDGGQHGLRGYIPCGGEVLAERRFGDLVIPSHVRVGWWFGTPRFAPFFEAHITAATAVED